MILILDAFNHLYKYLYKFCFGYKHPQYQNTIKYEVHTDNQIRGNHIYTIWLICSRLTPQNFDINEDKTSCLALNKNPLDQHAP